MKRHTLLTRRERGPWELHENPFHNLHKEARNELTRAVLSLDPERTEPVHTVVNDITLIPVGHGRIVRAIITDTDRDLVQDPLKFIDIDRFCPRTCEIPGSPLAHYLGHDTIGTKLANALSYHMIDLTDAQMLYQIACLGRLRSVGKVALTRFKQVMEAGRHFDASPGVIWARSVVEVRRQLDANAPAELRSSGALRQALEHLHAAETVLVRNGQESEERDDS